jgi:hypothetical protein
VADNPPTVLALHEDAQMGRVSRSHRLSTPKKLTTALDPGLHQGDVWPNEADVLSHELVTSGHHVRLGEHLGDHGPELVSAGAGNSEHVRPEPRSHAFIQF